MRLFLTFILVFSLLLSCKKKNDSLPEYYVAMDINNQHIVMTAIESTIDVAPLRFSFSARDSNNLHRINFAVTDYTPGTYPQFTDTTEAPDYSQRLWIDCSYIPAGGNWRFLRPIAGKESGTLTVTNADQNVVSGTFHAWIGTAEDPLQLTNGSFRIKLR